MKSGAPPTRVAVVGAGKMGLSHLAIANALSGLDVVGVCDPSSYVLDVLRKNTGIAGYKSLDDLLNAAQVDAVIIATPSSSHASLVKTALSSGLHVFCEKPFTLSPTDAHDLTELAAASEVVTQVGYHYRFVGSFLEAKRLIDAGAIGDVNHVLGEAYGPVVLKAKGGTWRGRATEGGGALYDYAAHVVDLICWLMGAPVAAGGTSLGRVFSRETEDQVAATLFFPAGRSAQVSVNWSDEAYRKMSTAITVRGSAGTLYADRQECRVFLRDTAPSLAGYRAGWNVKYTTELTQPVEFYLRGEEYTSQLAHFAENVAVGRRDGQNAFSSAAVTDSALALMASDALVEPTDRLSGATALPRRKSARRIVGELFTRARLRRA